MWTLDSGVTVLIFVHKSSTQPSSCDTSVFCIYSGSFSQRNTGQERNIAVLRAQISFSKLFSMCTNPMVYILTDFRDTMLSDYKTRSIVLFAASCISKIDLLLLGELLGSWVPEFFLLEWKTCKLKSLCAQREGILCFVLFCFVYSTTIQSVQFPQWTGSTKIQERNCQWMNEEIFYRMAGSENLYLQCMVMRCCTVYSLSETTYVCDRDCLQLFSWKNKSNFDNNC